MDTDPHQRDNTDLSSTQTLDGQRLSESEQYNITPLKLLKQRLPWNWQEQLGVVPAPCFNYAAVSESVICGKPEKINLLKGKKIPKPKPRTKDALCLTLVTWVQIVCCLSRPVQSELSRATKRQNREITVQLK